MEGQTGDTDIGKGRGNYISLKIGKMNSPMKRFPFPSPLYFVIANGGAQVSHRLLQDHIVLW